MSKRIGILYDNISGNIGDLAIGISVRKILREIGVEFEELVPGRFNPRDYDTIVIGGGYLLQPSPNFFYDKFKVPGTHILNSCGILGSPDDLEYLNDYSYVSVRSNGDKQKLSYLTKKVKVVPCTSMLLNDLPIRNQQIREPSIGVQLWEGLIDEEPLVEYLSSQSSHIYFLPITHYNHDFKYLAKLSQKVKNSSLLPILGPEEVFTLVGKLDYLITASLHGAIFAYTHEVPFTLFDSQDKQRFFMQDRGLDSYLFRNFAELQAAFELLQNSKPDYSSSLDRDLKTLKEHRDTIRDILSAKHFVLAGKNKPTKPWAEPVNLEAKLSEMDFQTHYLQKQVKLLDTQISELGSAMQAKDSQISELGSAMQAKDSQISELGNDLQAKDSQIQQMQRGIVMQLLSKYQRAVERVLHPGTGRRYYYELGLTGIRVILNEGWRSFFRKVKIWLRLRRATAREHVPGLPRFKASILWKEAEKLVLPEPSQKPELSIIIPVYNKWQYTVNCLKSICENTEADYEVIVVDDASSDETAKILLKVRNLHLVRNEQNAGFIGSCNWGAKASKSNYILFLNNDTMVTKGWLPPLLEIIKGENVGAVGSKLIYPDRTLQEAGSIIWNDGSALGYGRGDDSGKPEYSYVREVDYCSGACLLVKRELFEKIGGFDERFKPGYYEDSDLCLSLRNLGYKVMYQPMSVVVHFEGVTCGTDISSGIKKYQEINKPKFVEKWGDVLPRYQRYPSPENILWGRNRLPGKNVLVMDDRIPTPSQGAGYPRAHSMLKFIGEFGYKVTFFPLGNSTPWQPYTHELQQLGIEVFYGDNLDFIQFAKDRADYYDLILVSRPHNMERAFGAIERFFPNAVLVYDAEAMFSLREILKAKVKGTKLKEEDAERMMNEEINLMKKADLVITVSENEKVIILERTRLNNVTIWGHALEVKEPQTPFYQRKDILFVGGFLALDSPNEDAILYFAKEIFPEVEEELHCRLFIVGMNPPASIKKLSSPSINVTGYVEDLREYYEGCRVFIVPHRYSAGIPWKLQEAMSYGIPCVVSELTASQLDLTDGKEVLVAKNSEEFIRKIIKLYQDEELWHQIQHNALNYIQEDCNPETLKTTLNDIIERGLKCQDKSRNMTGKMPNQQREIIHYLRGIVKANEAEKQYFDVHEIRFWETFQLASKVVTPGANVLDVGSHPATMPTLIKKYLGCSVCCCNLGGGPMMRVVNPEHGDEFQFDVIELDVEKEALPYPDASFDLVLCCEVLEHMKCDPMFMLAEINRVLKLGSFLLLTTPNLACARSVQGMLEGWHPNLSAEYVVGSTDRHSREYTVHEVKALLECGGFEIVSLDTKDVWGGPYPDIIDVLKKLGKPTNLRGDAVFALVGKKSAMLERYPSKFYQM